MGSREQNRDFRRRWRVSFVFFQKEVTFACMHQSASHLHAELCILGFLLQPPARPPLTSSQLTWRGFAPISDHEVPASATPTPLRRPRRLHPQSCWRLTRLLSQARADAPSAATTLCSQRETSSPSVVNPPQLLSDESVKGYVPGLWLYPLQRGLICDKRWRGEEKKKVCRKVKQTCSKWLNNVSCKECGAKLRLALKWSHTFCMIIAVKFLIWSQQARKQQQLGISPPPHSHAYLASISPWLN